MIVRTKAPLRVGFAGGGTDVSPYSELYGGYVLNATIDLYAHCTIETRRDNDVLFKSLDRGDRHSGRPDTELDTQDNLLLHKAVYNRIVRDYNQGKPLPVTVNTYSDAPPGSGLGSSSTIVVAMLVAYRELLALPLGEYEIAHLAYKIERIDAGLAGGKQDQYSATFGGFNFMEFYKDDRVIVNPLRIKADIVNELNARMLLYHGGRSRQSADIIKEQAEHVARGDESSIESMHRVKQEAVAMKESLLKSDFDSFSLQLGRSWDAKKGMARSITNEQIEKVHETAIAAGAVSGKVSGAGGGGFIMFCVDPVKRIDVTTALESLGGSVVSFQFTNKGAEAWRV